MTMSQLWNHALRDPDDKLLSPTIKSAFIVGLSSVSSHCFQMGWLAMSDRQRQCLASEGPKRPDDKPPFRRYRR